MIRPVTRLIAVALLLAAPLAGAAAQRIKLPASLKELEDRARKDSLDPAAQYNVALAYWNAKRWDDADSALHRAIRLDPRFAAAYYGLYALVYARRPSLSDEEYRGDVPADWKPRLAEADRWYARAVLIDPLVDQRLGDVIRQRSTTIQDALKELYGEWAADFLEGIDLYYEGRYDKSYTDFQRVYNEINSNASGLHEKRLWNELVYWHGLAAAQTARNDEAVADFELLYDRYVAREDSLRDSTLHVPLKTNDYRYLAAVMRERAGQVNEAIDGYRQSVQNDIGLFMAHVHLANIYEAHRMWPQALAERQAAVNANPDDPSLLLDLGKTYAMAGQWDQAETTLKQAADANPRDARVPYLLGIVDQQEQKPADARAALEHFIAIAPSRYAAQVNDAKQRLAALR